MKPYLAAVHCCQADEGTVADLADRLVGVDVIATSSTTSRGIDELRDRLYGMLPHVKITDLLLEVDRWTGFTRRFTHLKTGESAKDPTLLLTAILADATNLGLAKIAGVVR